MKKVIVVSSVVFLLMAASAFSANNMFDLKGKMTINAYGGYSIGMGDAFKDYKDLAGDSYSSKGGISFGGQFHYGVAPKLMIGGEIGFQGYKSEFKSAALPAYNSSSTSTEVNILGSVLYAMNYTEDKAAMYLTGGAGIYGGSNDLGLFGGVLYRTKVSPKVGLIFMPRFHIILSDASAYLLQLAVGVEFPVGKK